MADNVLGKKSGILLLVIVTTIVSTAFAILITFLIIKTIGKGNLILGVCIASSCALLITPPISYYFFLILKALHQNRFELKKTNEELKHALEKVQVLSGLLPICSNCKKIRDSDGYWNQLETYIEKHSSVFFTHGLCEHCLNSLYGSEEWFLKKSKK